MRIFDEHYVETVPFGPHVARVRLMRPEDRLRILEAQLPRSRLRLELDFFCGSDGGRQVALIALSDAGAAVGAARGFRVRAGVWNATVTAIDAELTSALLDRLTLAMLDRGACEVRFDFSPDDVEMWRRLGMLAPRAAFRDGEDGIECTVTIR
jgi:hypothetical protein